MNLYVPRGLDASDYLYYDKELGKDIPARTYYLAR